MTTARSLTAFLLVLSGAVSGVRGADAGPPATPAPPPLSAYAAVGSSLVQSARIAELGWTDAQLEAFISGVRAGVHGRDLPVDDSTRHLFEEISRRVNEPPSVEKHPTAEFSKPTTLAAYMHEAQKHYHLQFSDSGLGFSINSGIGGAHPRPQDVVVVTCSALAADGTTRIPKLCTDGSRVRVADLLPGLVEGLQMMTVNSQAIFVIPPDLSFGDRQWPEGTERGTPMILTITLHEIISPDAVH